MTSNYVFGVGLEKETTFTFQDKKRKKTSYIASSVKDTNKFRIDNLMYHHNTSNWSGKTKRWYPRDEKEGDVVGVSYDSTVIGRRGGNGGFEFGTAGYSSLNVKPKDMLVQFNIAIKEFADNLKSLDVDNSVNRTTPFSSPVSYNTESNRYGNVDGPGSWHINITVPFDKNRVRNEMYLKKYYDKFFRGIKVIRAIQPLVVAMIGGADYKSVCNPSRIEGSSRQAYVSYGNLGNTRLDSNFKQVLMTHNSAHGAFKGGNEANKYRRKIKNTDLKVAITDTGDFCPKKFNNVPVRSVEIRFLDTFHIPVMYDIMKVIVSALQHGENVGDITDAGISDDWQEASARIVVEGWNARLPKSYIDSLNDKLGLNLTAYDNMRADMVFNEMAKQLWNKNKTTSSNVTGNWVKILFDEFSEPNVINLNKLNWEAQFRHKYVSSGSFKTYIDKVLSTIVNIDASKSNGWLNANYDKEKFSVRDVLLDDNVYGKDFASEDYEDFLFLLERIKTIKIEESKTGRIEKIKFINTDLKDIFSSFDNLKDLETDIIKDVLDVEPEPTPTPEPTPEEPTESAFSRAGIRTEPERVVVSQEQSAIDTDLLNIVRITPERDSMADYNRRDLEQTFNLANYTNNTGEVFSVRVIASKISYNNRNLYCFWKKESNRSVVIYVNDDVLENEETITDIVSVLKNNFYSNVSVDTSNVFVSNLTVTEFFNRLESVARNHYFKNSRPQTKIIKLDRTGVEKLRQKGLVIVSLLRGKKYFIADRSKWHKLFKMYSPNLRIVKYIPYQKNISVQKYANEYRLIMDNKIIDVMEV